MREHQQGLNGEGSHFCCQIYNPSFSPDCPKLVKLPYLSVFYSFRLRSLFSSTTQMPSNITSHMKSLLISSGIVNYSPSQSRAFLPEHFVCSLGHNHHIILVCGLYAYALAPAGSVLGIFLCFILGLVTGPSANSVSF